MAADGRRWNAKNFNRKVLCNFFAIIELSQTLIERFAAEICYQKLLQALIESSAKDIYNPEIITNFNRKIGCRNSKSENYHKL